MKRKLSIMLFLLFTLSFSQMLSSAITFNAENQLDESEVAFEWVDSSEQNITEVREILEVQIREALSLFHVNHLECDFINGHGINCCDYREIMNEEETEELKNVLGNILSETIGGRVINMNLNDENVNKLIEAGVIMLADPVLHIKGSFLIHIQ